MEDQGGDQGIGAPRRQEGFCAEHQSQYPVEQEHQGRNQGSFHVEHRGRVSCGPLIQGPKNKSKKDGQEHIGRVLEERTGWSKLDEQEATKQTMMTMMMVKQKKQQNKATKVTSNTFH
jgi:hypothetical protein